MLVLARAHHPWAVLGWLRDKPEPKLCTCKWQWPLDGHYIQYDSSSQWIHLVLTLVLIALWNQWSLDGQYIQYNSSSQWIHLIWTLAHCSLKIPELIFLDYYTHYVTNTTFISHTFVATRLPAKLELMPTHTWRWAMLVAKTPHVHFLWWLNLTQCQAENHQDRQLYNNSLLFLAIFILLLGW